MDRKREPKGRPRVEEILAAQRRHAHTVERDRKTGEVRGWKELAVRHGGGRLLAAGRPTAAR